MVDKESGEGTAVDNPNQIKRKMIGRGNERGRKRTDIATGKGTTHGTSDSIKDMYARKENAART